MPDYKDEIEAAKRRRSFDAAMKKALRMHAVRLGATLDERAALNTIKRRINRDKIFPEFDA